MKDYDTFTNEVFSRINEYNLKHKNIQKKKNVLIISAVSCALLIVVGGLAVLSVNRPEYTSSDSSQKDSDKIAVKYNSDEYNSDTPTQNRITASDNTVSAESNVSAFDTASIVFNDPVSSSENSKNHNSDSKITDTPSNIVESGIIYMLVPEEIPNCEFAGDMYRPDEYNGNIASALALKLNYSNNRSQKFNVVMNNRNKEVSFEQIIDDVNNTLNDIIDISMISKVKIKNGRNENSNNEYFTKNMYFAKINAEQIIALADKGIYLRYVGSGVGSVRDMNWDTPEGINVFCELNGDMMIFKGDDIICYPDLYVE